MKPSTLKCLRRLYRLKETEIGRKVIFISENKNASWMNPNQETGWDEIWSDKYGNALIDKKCRRLLAI